MYTKQYAREKTPDLADAYIWVYMFFVRKLHITVFYDSTYFILESLFTFPIVEQILTSSSSYISVSLFRRSYFEGAA